MAAPSRRTAPALNQQLFVAPHRFDFFQAVRLLEWRAHERARRRSFAPVRPVGEDAPPRWEVVRLRPAAALSHRHSTVGSLLRSAPAAGGIEAEADPDAAPPQMQVHFMGLTGPAGVLPDHYTAQIISRLRQRDAALADFLALFDHRLLSLMFRAWRKNHFPAAYERFAMDTMDREQPVEAEEGGRVGQAGGAAAEDPFTASLYALVGMGQPALRGRSGFADELLLYYAGHFAHRPRCAVGIQLILGDHFSVPVKLLQFQGQWLHISPSDRSRMPDAEHPQGLNNQLGVNTVVGERVWDVQSRVRVRLGPLTLAQYRWFLPSGDGLSKLSRLVRLYVGPQFDFDVQLVLRGDDVPPCRLGGDGKGPQLGWTTFLKSEPMRADFEDAVFEADV